MSLWMIVALIALILIGIGFALGWYVRGGEVKKLRESQKR